MAWWFDLTSEKSGSCFSQFILQIPSSECCQDHALLLIDLDNGKTTRVCGQSHDPILVNSNNVTLFVKGDNSNNDIQFNLTLKGWYTI